jgi:hypothetical protein
MSKLHPASTAQRAAERRIGARMAYGLLAAILLLAFIAWAVDFVTLEGERTVYTVDCAEGAWSGNRCTGSLVVGDRYRFRALRAHREVLFWTVGSAEPAGKLTGCDVTNGRNWICPPGGDGVRSITLRMERGRPSLDKSAPGRHIHPVPKLRWLLMRMGVGWGSSADD